MFASETISNQYIAWDHALSVPVILLLCLACSGLMIYALGRERKILGFATTTLFASLRLIALATVFWMLLAPTSVLEETTSTRKSIAILTDVSASMTTVDPPGVADELRWLSAQVDPDKEAPLGLATQVTDQGVAALGVANRELIAAIKTLQGHGGEHEAAKHLLSAGKGIENATAHLSTITDSMISDPTTSATVQPLLRRLSRLLESPEFDTLADVGNALHLGRTPAETGWRESLPDLLGRTVTTRRVYEELAGQLARSEQQRLAELGPDALRQVQAVQSQTRLQRVASFLDRVRQSTLTNMDETADVRWSSFDQASRGFGDEARAAEFLRERSEQDGNGERLAAAQQTDLTAALRQIRRMKLEQPVAAAFVISDAAHNYSNAGHSNAGHADTRSDGGGLPGDAPSAMDPRRGGTSMVSGLPGSETQRTPVEVAAQLGGTPVYMIPIGNQSRVRDIDLVSTSAPSVAMRNDDVVIEAYLEAYQCAGERCVVKLLRDAEVVDFRNIEIDSNSVSRAVRFDQRVSEVGSASFQIAIEALDGEMTTENNFDEVEINVTRNEIKVLLADEMPRWEYRYLAQLFRRDPKVDLDELLYRPRSIATGHRAESGTFPISVDQWDQYDVVILGDIPTDHFPVAAQETLMEYLRTRGGTLVLIAGNRAMPQAYVEYPLQRAIPVLPMTGPVVDREAGFSFRVTEEGRSHAALMIGETEQATREAWDFVNRFSPLHEVSPWRIPRPTAHNLIAADRREIGGEDAAAAEQTAETTFLCWQAVGRGRVVYLSAPDTYRLRFLRGDRLHYRFWGQLMRWAIASDLSTGNQAVRIRTGRTKYETQQPVDVEVELFDSEGGPVVDTNAGEDELHLRLSSGEDERKISLIADEDQPGHYRAEIKSLPPGVYQVQPVGTLVDALSAGDPQQESDDRAVATFTVKMDLPMELVDTRCNRVLASQIAELTGGQVLPPTALAEILALTDLEPVVSKRVQRQPLWLRWKYLWIVFGCLQIEWIIRKWRGLS